MVKTHYHIVNGITLYRLLAVPLLFFLIFNQRPHLFKWILAFSFFTDIMDGYFARRFKVVSILGAKLDSIADDFTIIAAMTGVFIFRSEFLKEHFIIIALLFVLYLFQLILSVIRYGKISSFHTYSAKMAALFQGTFLILLFFLPKPVITFFYTTIFVTAINLIEEIILVLLLPQWQTDIKGLYWVRRRGNSKRC